MPTQPKAVLLDMDGTLFNTEAIYKTLWQSTAAKFGLDLTDERYHRFIGARYDQCLGYIQELGGPDLDTLAFKEVMDREEQVIPIPLKPGTLELFDWIAANNIPTGLVTSSSKNTVHQHFRHYDGIERFAVVITGDDVKHPKPNPEPYLLACQMLNIRSQEAIAVEDSNAGALSAIQAGCQTVVIPDVLPPVPEVAESAAIILNSLEQLPEWIEHNRR